MVRSISGALRGRRKALAGFCFNLCLPTLRFLGLPLLAFARLIIWPVINLQGLFLLFILSKYVQAVTS